MEIRNAAWELGFAGCGIVRFEALREYAQRLDERIRACPKSKPILEPLRRYASPETVYPWAKAVIVCVTDYSRYHVPEPLDGRIGRYYLFDHKLQPQAPGNLRIAAFESHLDRMGIRWAKELHGVTSARMAAERAGLGIVRRNNFLYTTHGSRTILDTWVIDRETEAVESSTLPACPPECRQCVDACPTRALSGPHCTDAVSCVTLLTWGARGLPSPDVAHACGAWIYGCDQCQDACPHNTQIPRGTEEYPGLQRLAETLTLPGILAMDEPAMMQVLLPRFWFIPRDRLWLWKVNALRAMANDYRPEYAESIARAREDVDERVREMAERVARTPPSPRR